MLYTEVRANAQALKQECNQVPCLRSSKRGKFCLSAKARGLVVGNKNGKSTVWMRSYRNIKVVVGTLGFTLENGKSLGGFKGKR